MWSAASWCCPTKSNVSSGTVFSETFHRCFNWYDNFKQTIFPISFISSNNEHFHSCFGTQKSKSIFLQILNFSHCFLKKWKSLISGWTTFDPVYRRILSGPLGRRPRVHEPDHLDRVLRIEAQAICPSNANANLGQRSCRSVRPNFTCIYNFIFKEVNLSRLC